MEDMLTRVTDELCGDYIVVTDSSNPEQKISEDDLTKIFQLLRDPTYIHSEGCIYISVRWQYLMQNLKQTTIMAGS